MAIKYTEEQLNSVDKSMLIQMFLNQQEQLEKVSANLHSLDTKMQAMMEQLILGNKNRFGRSSEKMEDTQQMRFIEVDEHHVGVYASKTDGKGGASKEPAPWKPGFSISCCSYHEWKVCKCGSALPSGTGVHPIWPCYNQTEHGKLDDPVRGRIPFRPV